MSISYDESKWPWLMVKMPAEAVSDQAFVTHLERMSKYFAKGDRFGFVIDALGAPPLNAMRRRQVADLIDREMARHGENLIGMAVVLSSPVARGVFKVIQWTSRTRHPMMSFDTVDAALGWLRSLSAGVPKSKPKRAVGARD
jgi:hypothetical protein